MTNKHVRKLTCKHFNGTMNKCCAVGILYDRVQDTSTHPYSYPCLPEGAKLECDLRLYPSDEELAAEDAWLADHLAKMRTARSAIMDAAKGRRSVSGAIDCPVCKTGKLHFSVAYNGHVHAQCTTKDCMWWME